MVLFGPRENVEPVIYETIDAEIIAKLAFSTKGTSGPSKFDANDWKRILANKIYDSEGHDLSDAIARMVRLLCTEDVDDPDSISAAMACRLIPLDKNPGYGRSESVKYYVVCLGKLPPVFFRSDIETAAGSLQLCAGQKGGCEAAIHSMVDIYEDADRHANNAFNTINRKALLNNIAFSVPYCTFLRSIVTRPQQDC